ncbi:hypothetical protein LTR85_011335 [Meristemomyces frigidus]|nr:hypothetical protein LTR85_011335 [Meristemomyces frigidus]
MSGLEGAAPRIGKEAQARSAQTEPVASADDEDNGSITSSTSSKSGSRWRTQDIIFAFGPEKSYFMSTALGHWRYWGPREIADSFSEHEINQPAAIAFAPEGDYLFVFEEHDGSMSVKHFKREKMIPSTEAAAFIEARREYEMMYDFVRESKDTDVRRMVSFSIGPGGSWFARRGKQVAHNGLPADLLMKIKEREVQGAYPHQVALGMYSSYVVVWSDDTWSWDLNGYGSLAQYLKDEESIDTIVLSPFDCTEFFLVQESGRVMWSLNGDHVQLGLIMRDAQGYMQREARREQKTITTHVNGKSVIITPDTHFGESPAVSFGVSRILRQLGFAPNDAARPLPDPGGSLPSLAGWKWSEPHAMSDRHHLIAVGAAAVTSAVVVSLVAHYGQRHVIAASGSSALSTAVATRMAGMPLRRAALAAGLAAVGTGALCSWISE